MNTSFQDQLFDFTNTELNFDERMTGALSIASEDSNLEDILIYGTIILQILQTATVSKSLAKTTESKQALLGILQEVSMQRNGSSYL